MIFFEMTKAKTRFLIKFFLIAWSSLLTTPSIHSESVLTLNCATNEFAPFGFEEAGVVKGIEVEILQEIGKRLNINISVKMLPWKRMLSGMQEGKLDCIFAAFKTEERQGYMDYCNVPIHVSSLVFYVHQDNPIPFNKLEDLKGHSVGLVRGFKTSPGFDEAVKKKWFTIKEANDFEQIFRILNTKRFDTVLVNRHVGDYVLKKLGLPNIVALPTPLTTTSAYITFSKKKNLAFLIPKFDPVLFEILADGTYRKIFEKYTK